MLAILRLDSDDRVPGSARVTWMQTDKHCDVSGVSSFAVAVGYALVVIPYMLLVFRDDNFTLLIPSSSPACQAVLQFCGGGGIHTSGCISHPPG
jgi:hypothetical protein